MKETEEGRTSMCEMMEKMLEKTNAAGKAEGKAEGKMIAIYEFVRDGIITPSEGAVRANQTEMEFKAGMDAYFAQLASA